MSSLNQIDHNNGSVSKRSRQITKKDISQKLKSKGDNTLSRKQISYSNLTSIQLKQSFRGDTGLMHLIAQIDNGIRMRKNLIQTERALMFR